MFRNVNNFTVLNCSCSREMSFVIVLAAKRIKYGKENINIPIF